MHAIVVLGAQNRPDGALTPMAIARCRGALGVLRRCPGARLLVTGGYGTFNRAPLPHAHYLTGFLREQGVRESDLLPWALSSNTVEDAWLARKILEPFHLDALTIVTSLHHLERAHLVFACVFNGQAVRIIATASATGEDDLQRMREHERRALAEDLGQRGVIVEGKFFPCPQDSCRE